MMWSKGIFLFRASLMILLVLGLLPQPSSEAMLSVNAQTIGLMSESTTWRQLFPETLPDPRDLTAFSYDTSRNVFVLFSGRKEVYTWYDDTWEWDGNNWNRKYSSISPSPRSSHGMTFDRQKNTSVMFGGFDGGWPTETWEWNGSQWSYFNSSPALSRTGVALAFDDIRGVVTLFGGFGAYPMNDTWILEGNMWRQLTPAVSPPVRDRAAMVYDSDRGNIILFGGGDNNYVYLNDTWEWDGANWSEKIAASPPPGRSGHAMAYDSSRKKVILFGGSGTTDQRTWEWDGSTWKDGAPVKSPPVRTNHVMEYDPVRNQVVLFGGSDPTNRDIKYNDTWVYEHLKIEMVSFEYRLNPKQTINIPIDLDGSKVPLDLAITGLPNGVNATLSQSSSIIPPSQAVLQLVAGPRVSLGTYPVTVSASTDIQSTSLQFNLTVAKKSKR